MLRASRSPLRLLLVAVAAACVAECCAAACPTICSTPLLYGFTRNSGEPCKCLRKTSNTTFERMNSATCACSECFAEQSDGSVVGFASLGDGRPCPFGTDCGASLLLECIEPMVIVLLTSDHLLYMHYSVLCVPRRIQYQRCELDSQRCVCMTLAPAATAPCCLYT